MEKGKKKKGQKRISVASLYWKGKLDKGNVCWFCHFPRPPILIRYISQSSGKSHAKICKLRNTKRSRRGKLRTHIIK